MRIIIDIPECTDAIIVNAMYHIDDEPHLSSIAIADPTDGMELEMERVEERPLM